MKAGRGPDLRKYANIVSTIRIEHPACEDAYNELTHIYDFIGTTATPACLLISGDTRTGKSSVVKDMLEEHLPRIVDNKIVRNVVYAVAPAKATVKSLLEALLKGLEDPHWSRGTETAMTQRLYTMLDAVECKMIILDEFQHLCDKGQVKKLDLLADWLKVLIESRKYALVAVGLPAAAAVIYGHKQLIGRFNAEIQMPLFDWKDHASRLQFRGVLKQFEKELHPFRLPALDGPEMALRMYLATAGRIGLIAKLLDRAVHNAIRSNTLDIRLADLDKAYSRAIWGSSQFPISGGPFMADMTDLESPLVHQSVLRNAALESVADESGGVVIYGHSPTPFSAADKASTSQGKSTGGHSAPANGRRRRGGTRSKLEQELAEAI